MLSYLLNRFVFQCGIIDESMQNLLFCRKIYRPIVSKAIFMDKIIVDHTRCTHESARARACNRALAHMINQSMNINEMRKDGSISISIFIETSTYKCMIIKVQLEFWRRRLRNIIYANKSIKKNVLF